MRLPWYLDVSFRPWETYHAGVPVLTVDLETTNLEKGDPRNPANRLVKVAVKIDGGPVTSDSAKFFDTLEEREGKPAILVAHNAKFELAWLNREGFDTSQWLVWDTMVGEYVIAGNRKWPLDLDSVARRHGLGSKGRMIDRMMKAGVCPSEMPVEALRERVEWDVEKTHALFLKQRAIIEETGLMRVMFTRSILTPVLAHMEGYGMELDGERVREEHDRLTKRRTELLAELEVIAKGKKLKGPQLAALVYDDLKFAEVLDWRGNPIKTDGGERSTKADTLSQLTAKTPEQKRFLETFKEYNKVDNAITKYMAFFYGIVTEKGGHFVANFHQTRVATHRLSSSGKKVTFQNGKSHSVQFQNLPRAYKRLFRVPSGRSLSEVDGAQLEFRVGGSLARDPQILADVTSGADIHRFTASKLLRIPEERVTKEQRQEAKANTFKPMYGGQSGTKRQKEYYAAFRTKYRTLYETQMGWAHEVLRTGQLRIASGLIFYWPGTKMSRTGYIDNTPSIFDYPIQSLATADIIPIGLTYAFWTLRAQGIDAKLLNTIHDSIAADVADEDLDRYHKVVVECLLDRTYEYLEAVYGIDLYVPLGAAYKAGTHWGDGDETTISYAKRTA